MKLLKKTNYPAYTVDNVDDMVLKDSNGVPLICSHEFNKLESGMRVKKWRKQDIHFGDTPLHGMLPLHYLYYRMNEAQIPAMTQMGYN